MHLTQTDNLLIKALYGLAAGIVMLQVLGIGAAVSGLFTLTFFLVILLWLSTAQRMVSTTDLLAWGIILLAVIHVFLNALQTHTALSFGYIKKAVMFSTSVLYIATVSKLRADQTLVRFLSRVNTVLALYLVLFFFARNQAMHVLNGRASRYLTFGFTNPNLAGLFLTCIALHEGASVQRAQRWFEKLLHIVLLAMLCYFIVLTEARSALIVTAFFLLFGLWLVLRGKTYQALPRWLLALAAVFPLIFAGLYLSFVRSDWINQTFSFLVDEGKALTNRVGIWLNAFRAFADSPFLGAYSQLSRGTGTFQMHNTHVDILASYGALVLVGVCVLLYRAMAAKNTEITRQTSSLFLAAFIGALSLGIGEAALFSGGIGIYLFACEFLLLANPLSGEDGDEARISE